MAISVRFGCGYRTLARRWTAPWLALSVAVPLALAGCQSSAEKAAAAAAQAQQLAAAGNYAAAAQQYDLAVRLRDDLPDLWIARARNQVSMGDYSGAFASYRSALDQDRTNREALDALAQLSLAANALDQATDYADQTLTFDPSNLNAQLVKATVALRRGRIDAAQTAAETLFKANPDQEPVRVLMSRILQRRGDTARALAMIAPIFAAGGGSADLRRQLTALYQQDFDTRAIGAVAARDAAAAPGQPAPQLALARNQLLLGQSEAAARTLEAIHRAAPGDALRDQTVTMFAETDLPAATIARLPVQHPGLILSIAEYAIARQDYVTARRLLGDYAGRTPDALTTDAQGALAVAEIGTGEPASGGRRADAVIALDPHQPMALVARVMLALARNDGNAALGDARVIVADNPQWPDGYALLSQVYRARGEAFLADKTLTDGANALEDDAAMLRLYVAGLIRAGRADDAIAATRVFTVRNPDSVSGWATRQQACRTTGDTACVARVAAILARLHGQAVALPPTPPGEVSAEADLRNEQDARP